MGPTCYRCLGHEKGTNLQPLYMAACEESSARLSRSALHSNTLIEGSAAQALDAEKASDEAILTGAWTHAAGLLDL